MRSKIAPLFAASFAIVGMNACNSDSADAGSGAVAAPSPVAAPTPPAPTPPAPALTGTPTLTTKVLMSGLQNPWDIAFTPDGTMLFTQRGGGLYVRRTDGSQQRIFTAADVVVEGQSGYSGVAVDPAFATNRTIYVYFASSLGGAKNNRVARMTVDAGYTATSNRTDIVTGITFKITPAPGAPAGTGAHNGGRLRFGPDGYLYVTTGDTHNPMVPQSKTELGGKVLRVRTDGTAAPGNNAPAGFDARVFAYGFRNPQGIAFHPSSTAANVYAFTSEHGPGHTDEVTPIVAGGNAGWDPVCLDGVSYCGYGSNQTNGTPTPMTDTAKFAAAMRPLWTNGGKSQGMAGSDFLIGNQWRDWNGALAVGFMSGLRLEVLQLKADRTLLKNTPVYDGMNVRIRAVTMGPDGALYLGTDSKSGGDEIWQVTAK